MFLAQLATSMLVWAAMIVVLVRRKDDFIARFRPFSRGKRAAAAVSFLVTSIALLALLMGALAGGGLAAGALTWWGWLLVALFGALFIFLQTAALVPLVLNAVTREPDESSDRLDRP